MNVEIKCFSDSMRTLPKPQNAAKSCLKQESRYYFSQKNGLLRTPAYPLIHMPGNFKVDCPTIILPPLTLQKHWIYMDKKHFNPG